MVFPTLPILKLLLYYLCRTHLTEKNELINNLFLKITWNADPGIKQEGFFLVQRFRHVCVGPWEKKKKKPFQLSIYNDRKFSSHKKAVIPNVKNLYHEKAVRFSTRFCGDAATHCVMNFPRNGVYTTNVGFILGFDFLSN